MNHLERTTSSESTRSNTQPPSLVNPKSKPLDPSPTNPVPNHASLSMPPPSGVVSTSTSPPTTGSSSREIIAAARRPSRSQRASFSKTAGGVVFDIGNKNINNYSADNNPLRSALPDPVLAQPPRLDPDHDARRSSISSLASFGVFNDKARQSMASAPSSVAESEPDSMYNHLHQVLPH